MSGKCWLFILPIVCFTITPSEAAFDSVFPIHHEKSDKCLSVMDAQITLSDCNQENPIFLWKWVSQHRLFNMGSKTCLGIDLSRKQDQLKMFECDSTIMLWWRCNGTILYGAAQNKLALKNESVVTDGDMFDAWKQYGSNDSICKQPYHEIYTKDGNSFGQPCEIPFKFNGTWYPDCTTNGPGGKQEWCATTLNYDIDKKYGVCLKKETGCDDKWEKVPETQNCYQFNTQSALTWTEAHVSCRNQGGDLLSIANATELKYFEEKDLPDKMWIGLNQLDISSGWFWSNGMPLDFVNWEKGMPGVSVLDGSSCGMITSSGKWLSYSCDARFPYICKKLQSDLQTELSSDDWNYKETVCDRDWLPYNGFCYFSPKNKESWDNASQICSDNNSTLISMHTLADVELVITSFHNDTVEDIWIGLRSDNVSVHFMWSDGSKVTFTYWDRNEPNAAVNIAGNCVSYSGKLGRWHVKPCDEKFGFICKRKGDAKLGNSSDAGCPPGENWKRHGDSCYKVDQNEIPFGENLNLTIMNRFEQEFVNSLIKRAKNVEGKYFWTSLQDKNSTGEYTWGSLENEVSYTNWNSFQPDFPGGCVAIATGKSLGKWEVKDCKNFKAFPVYKKRIGTSKPPAVQPDPTAPCPVGWRSGNTPYCYKLFHRERITRKRTWEEAEQFCDALGAHLPSFSHMYEMQDLHDILREQISDDRWVWAGLNKRNPLSEGSWEWSDSRPVSIVIVPYDFQEDDDDIRDCAAFKTKTSTWHMSFLLPFIEQRKNDFYLHPFRCDVNLEWICQIPRGIPLKTPDWYVPDGAGINGSQLIVDGDEYWFVDDKLMTFQEATIYCKGNGGELASLESNAALQAVQKKIKQISKNENQRWWIKSLNFFSGYHRPRFHFYPFWYGHHRWQRDCTSITGRIFGDFTYREMDCNQYYPFVCEKRNISMLDINYQTPQKPVGACPAGWVSFGQKCFLLIKPSYSDFAKANDICQSHGGTLPSISNQAEQDFITQTIQDFKKQWIGLKISISSGIGKWIDGTAVAYKNFNPLFDGRPMYLSLHEFAGENELCTVLLNDPASSFVGTWNITSCSHAQNFSLCQNFQDPKVNVTNPMLNLISEYKGHNYTIIHTEVVWDDAVIKCAEIGMQLASIMDEYHQAYLAVQVYTLGFPLWIGLSSKDDGIHYSWSDGRSISYSRWAENEQGTGECVYLDTNGFWKCADCYTKQQGAICYATKDDNPAKVPNEEIAHCPHKIGSTPWVTFQNNCYTFQINQKRWRNINLKEAHIACKNIDADAYALNIRSELENNFVVEQLRPFADLVQWIWLGVIYDKNEEKFKWHDGTYVQYSNWKNGRPVTTDNDFLAGLNLEGSWEILSVSQKTYFQQHSIVVCKIDREPSTVYNSSLADTIPYGNYTYTIIRKQIQWYDALRECKQKGYDLASIHNEAQQLFLERIAKIDGFPLWTGLSSQDERSSNFEWADGSQFDYKSQQFENASRDGNCMYLDEKGNWKYDNCTVKRDGAICYKTTVKSEKLDQNEISSDCPQSKGTSNWVKYKDYCYAFDMNLYNFSVYGMKEAKTICQKLDTSAYLLSIKNADENAFISKHIKENMLITERVWLGISADAKSHNWRWLNDSEVSYYNWENKLNTDGRKSCAVILSSNGTWTAVSCEKGFSRIVCKVPIRSNKKIAAVVLAVLIVFMLIAGLIWYVYKNGRLRHMGFSAVRYERSFNDDDTRTFIDASF
ncbi:lymphocyte antigen 75 [Protopterus annectens]|uniref:lymphocyte antigen 75 n=1 Tax=Protopterus annectens TaxID=7888 RepID=UPI001CFA0096|nr:lymphocyte antigen 75 [Protopterus annectens]